MTKRTSVRMRRDPILALSAHHRFRILVRVGVNHSRDPTQARHVPRDQELLVIRQVVALLCLVARLPRPGWELVHQVVARCDEFFGRDAA